jgi:hypothetical protein
VTDTLEEAQKLIEELDLTPMIARGMKEKRRSPPAAPLRARRGRGGGYAPRLRRPLGGAKAQASVSSRPSFWRPWRRPRERPKTIWFSGRDSANL